MSEFRIECRGCEFVETRETHDDAVDRGLEHNATTGHLATVTGGESDD